MGIVFFCSHGTCDCGGGMVCGVGIRWWVLDKH